MFKVLATFGIIASNLLTLYIASIIASEGNSPQVMVMAKKLDYNRIKELGIEVHAEPVAHVLWDDLRKALGDRYDAFTDLFGCQTCLMTGPYAWDVEAVLERMASGRLTGTQAFPD